MDPILAGLLAEGAKAGMQVAFTYFKLAGKTDVEINRIFFKEFDEFKENHPSILPDV